MRTAIRSSWVRRGSVVVVTLVVCLSSFAPGVQAADDLWFGRDKALHATASTGIAVGGYGGVAVVWKRTRTRTRVLAGLGLSVGAGAAKEWWDRGRGTPSWRDFAWDGVGAAAGTTVAWLIDRARHRARPTRQAKPAVRRGTEPVGEARLADGAGGFAGAGEPVSSGATLLSIVPAVSLACPCP